MTSVLQETGMLPSSICIAERFRLFFFGEYSILKLFLLEKYYARVFLLFFMILFILRRNLDNIFNLEHLEIKHHLDELWEIFLSLKPLSWKRKRRGGKPLSSRMHLLTESNQNSTCSNGKKELVFFQDSRR